MISVFIDGSAGTTGLRIEQRLRERSDISLLTLPDSLRKDAKARAEALNDCDAAFLCLPDDAAREAVSMVQNERVILLDTSTAHRTDERFAYGFPELSEAFAEKIRKTRRIAVPGCHASGFIALVSPLISAGLLSKATPLSCFSLTGYTGGGKKMIADYENESREIFYNAPRQYALSQSHKHLKEMVAMTGLDEAPVFCPTVADFPCGMEVSVPLHRSQLAGTVSDIKEIYRKKYTGPVVRYCEGTDENGFLCASAFAGRDSMEISVWGNGERILLTARYDNLGKGASGAAVQCLNLSTGADEITGLQL